MLKGDLVKAFKRQRFTGETEDSMTFVLTVPFHS